MAVVNQLQVQQENQKEIVLFKPTENGDESNFSIALQQPAITKSTIHDIKDMLKIVMLKVGIRAQDLPTEEEKAVLIDHILLNYGNHTPAEIKLAFDMALSGKLEDVNGKGEPIELDVNCYFGNFTCLYFSRIMNAYRMWAKQTYNQLKVMVNAPAPEIENIDMITWIEEYRNKPETKIDLLPLCFYDFLSETVLTVTKEMKFIYLEKGCSSVKAELLAALPECKTNDALIEWKEFERMEKEGFTGKLKTLVTNRAKRLIVYDYLNF